VLQDNLKREEYREVTVGKVDVHKDVYERIAQWATEAKSYADKKEMIDSTQEARIQLSTLDGFDHQVGCGRHCFRPSLLLIVTDPAVTYTMPSLPPSAQLHPQLTPPSSQPPWLATITLVIAATAATSAAYNPQRRHLPSP
jgi:hypothetical protein